MLNMNDDYLIERLEALCRRFADTAENGRFIVAKEIKSSEQYLYQIITRKPMQNGNPRSVGKQLRKKLTERYPDWLGAIPPSPTPSQAAEPPTSAYKVKPQHDRKLVQRVCDLAETISDLGLKHLLIDAEEYAKKYPFARKQKGAAA